jgi:hypothetical protein
MMSNYDRANRLRAIATNAVREARIAYGRDDKPWIDDDAARAENIFQMLFLTELELVDGNMEHFPLVPKSQPQIEAAVRKVADVLGKLPDDIKGEPLPYKVPSKKDA